MDDLYIDGGLLEGGGQILRTAVALSAIIGRAIRINNIRAGRPKPGLGNQHLAGIKLASELSDAKLSDCHVGVTEISFNPSTIKCGSFKADAKTAGSVCLMLQVAVPILAYSNEECAVSLKGGTDAAFAPPVDYFREVFFHFMRKIGVDCTMNILRRGFYPQGGGEVVTKVKRINTPLKAINFVDFGSVSLISGHAFVAGRVPIKVANEMRQEAIKRFKTAFPSCPIQIEVFREDDSRCMGNIGTFMFIIHTSTDCRLAESGISNPRGPPHTQLVADAVDRLVKLTEMKACCDNYMQDQLILPMSLAEGRSHLRTGPLTLHTKTAIYVTEQILPVKFEVIDQTDGSTLLSCEGIGHIPWKQPR